MVFPGASSLNSIKERGSHGALTLSTINFRGFHLLNVVAARKIFGKDPRVLPEARGSSALPRPKPLTPGAAGCEAMLLQVVSAGICPCFFSRCRSLVRRRIAILAAGKLPDEFLQRL